MAETLLQYAAMTGDLTRRGVVEVFARETPLMDALRFMDMGVQESYAYSREASLGGIGFRSLNGDYAAAAKTVGVVNPIKEFLAIMGGTVPIDRQRWANPTYRANKIAMKAKAAAKAFVKYFIEGSTKASANQFDGLYRRLTGANVQWAGDDGAALDLDVLDGVIDFVPGEGAQKRLLMGAQMRRLIGAYIRAEGATMMSLAEWEGGRLLKSYNGVPILIAGEDETGAEIMDFDETRGNSDVTGSILCFRPGENDEEYLVGLAKNATQGVFEVEEQGVQGTTGTALVEGMVGLALHHPKCAQRYGGILETLPA
jgi:hypothetical protein